MKTILTKLAQRKLEAQQIYDPDNPENPANLEDYEFEETPKGGIPTYSPEDLEELEQENIEDENVPDSEQLKQEQPPDYPVFSTPFQALRWAKQNNEAIRISYTTLSGKGIIRDVEPVGDFYARTTGRRNLAVWDRNIGDVRTYIINNISAYEFLGEKFTPKFNFSQQRKNYMRRIHRRKRNKKVIL